MGQRDTLSLPLQGKSDEIIDKSKYIHANCFRPYFGRPSRPTTPRPKPMTLNIDMKSHKKMMDERVKMMRKTCQKYGDEVRYPKRVYGNHRLYHSSFSKQYFTS